MTSQSLDHCQDLRKQLLAIHQRVGVVWLRLKFEEIYRELLEVSWGWNKPYTLHLPNVSI